MGLFDRVKNLFTEEVEEEPIIKKEVRRVEPVTPPTRVEREQFKEEPEVKDEPAKEDKFVFFSDEDFKDLEKPKKEIKPEKKQEVKLPYRGAVINTKPEEKKIFKPSPIISPVYGVLDKNYSKEEITPKRETKSYVRRSEMTIDDLRNKAFGTVEDELENTLLGKTEFIEIDNIDEIDDLDQIDIFEELEKYEELDKLEKKVNDRTNVDGIFNELDDKKEKILGELDNKKDEILDELDSKKEDILLEEDIDDLELDDETLELSKQLESQKRKLDELNDFIVDDESEDFEEDLNNKHAEDELNESELFDLIDSMYEKRDEE